MEKVIQFLVATPADAYKVIDTLRSLDDKDEISVAEMYVLEKDSAGEISLRDSKGDQVSNIVFGSFAGGFIGMLGGPVGFLIGVSFGALFGGISDVNDADKRQAYLDKVGEKIPAGKSIVVCHIYEEWTEPINSSLGSISEIQRVNVGEEIEKAEQEEIDALDAAIDMADAEHKAAVAEKKTELQKKILDLKEKRAAKQVQLKEKMAVQKQAYENWFSKTKSKLKAYTKNL